MSTDVDTSRERVEATCAALCEYNAHLRLHEKPDTNGNIPPIEASWLHIAEEQMRALLARAERAEAERDENEGAFKVWRRRCHEAEAERDALAEQVEALRAEHVVTLAETERAAREDMRERAAAEAERVGFEEGRAECCGNAAGGYSHPPECCGDPIYTIDNARIAAAIRALTTETKGGSDAE